MTSVEQHVARRLRGKRRALGLSVEALAKALGVDPCLIEAYERATTPVPHEHLTQLCAVLQVPLSYFLPPTPCFSA